jgi:hypothetical protein
LGDVPAFQRAGWPRCGYREGEPKETTRLSRGRRPQRAPTIVFFVNAKEFNLEKKEVRVATVAGIINYGEILADTVTGIRGNVTALLENKDTEDVGKALDALTEAIKGEPRSK